MKALETFLAEGSRQRAEGRSKGEESVDGVIFYNRRTKISVYALRALLYYMKILENLLPDKTLLRLESCNLDEEQAIVRLLVSSIQASAKCPSCDSPTHKIRASL